MDTGLIRAFPYPLAFMAEIVTIEIGVKCVPEHEFNSGYK
jgi:hypothetical protein